MGSSENSEMRVGGGEIKIQQPDISVPDHALVALECPRCGSTHTKFSNYSQRNKSKPIHHCKNCRRKWTVGARLRASPGEWKRRQPELSMTDQASMSQVALKCPRCESTQTNFYGRSIQNVPKPVQFCKSCRRYWTVGGSLRTKRQPKDSDVQASVEGPESQAASKETTEVVQTKCTQLLTPSVEEPQNLSSCLVESDNFIVKDNRGQEKRWQLEGSGEMALVGGSERNVTSNEVLKVIHTQHSKSLSPLAEEHRPLSLCPEKFVSHIEKSTEGSSLLCHCKTK
ncbi:hypothetical protein FRX31_020319 [Thalictrum thalictroides]|uniref:Dof zinc finger protein n=1 Tax=Thalictrum thalictroides TaxID=46969 RepID=A0A7J6W1A0_THATH|nr:hypothetical protein FRX31_020319 [Thalictrum thalictroides]